MVNTEIMTTWIRVLFRFSTWATLTYISTYLLNYLLTTLREYRCSYYLVAGEDGSSFLSFLPVNILIFVVVVNVVLVHDLGRQ